MKKALALVMAIAMVASMAAVSFAATGLTNLTGSDKSVQAAVGFSDFLYTAKKVTGGYDWKIVNDTVVEFGKTVYLPLMKGGAAGEVDDADAVANVKVDDKWTKNGSYIKSVEIVKIDGTYCIAIETTGSELENVEIQGELQLAGKSRNKGADGKVVGDPVSLKGVKTAVNIELGWDARPADVDGEDVADNEKVVIDFKGIDDEEYVIEYGDAIDVETYMKNTKKVFVAFNDTESDELLDAYVDANLDFYNCTGAFRRTCTVTLAAEEGSYLYEVVDGALVPVDAEYDEWAEEFTFKTRTMGNYVVSDMELVAEEVVVANPSTGAAA